MTARLILAIVSTLVEEVALAVVVLLGLPQMGIHVPVGGLVAIMVAWGVVTVIIYRIGSQALRKKPIAGLPDMVSSRGEVVNQLAPRGVVRIKGELWGAKSAGRKIKEGAKVTVVGQDGLRLIVRKSSAVDLKDAE